MAGKLKSSIIFGVLQILLQVLLVVVDVPTGAGAQLQAAVGADLLDRGQELVLLLLGGGVVVDLLGLGLPVRRRELLRLVRVLADLPQRRPHVLHHLGVRIQALDDVLDLRVGHVLLPVLVRALGRDERLHGLNWVLPQLLQVLLVVIRRPLLVYRQGVGQVDGVRVVELGVLVHPGLFVHGLQCSFYTQVVVEEDAGLVAGSADYDLVDGPAPDDVGHRGLADIDGLQLLEGGSVEEVQVALLLVGVPVDGGAGEQVVPVGAQAHLGAREVVGQVAVVHNGLHEVPGVPHLQGPIAIAGGNLPAILQGQDGRVLFQHLVGIAHRHLRPVEVVLGAEALKRPVQAAPEDHAAVLGVGDGGDARGQPLPIPALQQVLVAQLLLDALQFLLHVPQPDAPVPRAAGELIGVDGVKLAIVDGVGVALRVVQLLHIHVALHRQK